MQTISGITYFYWQPTTAVSQRAKTCGGLSSVVSDQEMTKSAGEFSRLMSVT